MNYRLAKMDQEGLVTGYLVVIIGVYAGQERYAGALPNFPLGWTNPNIIFFTLCPSICSMIARMSDHVTLANMLAKHYF